LNICPWEFHGNFAVGDVGEFKVGKDVDDAEDGNGADTVTEEEE
jgi:hypothetical protein